MTLKLVPREVTPPPEVFMALQNILDAVKAEGIHSVAIAAVDIDGNTHTAYHSGSNIATLVGAIERLKHRLLTE